MWNVCYFTPPPLQQKHGVKIFFSPFHEALDSFSFSKIVFLEKPRNAFLDDLGDPQERVLGDLKERVPRVAVFNACFFTRAPLRQTIFELWLSWSFKNLFIFLNGDETV